MPDRSISHARVLRTAPWLLIVIGACALLFAGIAGLLWPRQGFSLTVGVLAMLAGLACLAWIDAVMSRVILEEDRLRVVTLWTRKTYLRSALRSVKFEWGAGVALERVAGGWVKLPELGRDAQGLANTLRAWLQS